MTLDLLEALARANLAIAAGVLVAAALRKPARRAFGARAAYLLWIVPALAGAAALLPPASTPAPLAAPLAVETFVAVAGGAVDTAVSRAPNLPALLAGLWIAGGLAVTALLLSRQARFVSGLGRLEPVEPGLYRAERSGTGPAVIGALFPRIVTPADFEARFGPQEREVVLAHERAHLAHGDAAANALAAAVLCACWFNPFVHLGVWLMRLDQELACDAAVLGRFPQARRLYAEVLLKTQLSNQALPFGCCWPPAGEHPLKERIVMLRAPLPAPARRALGVGAVVLLSVAGAAAAWAAQPGRPTPAAPVLTAGPAPVRLAQAGPERIVAPGVETAAVRAHPAPAATGGGRDEAETQTTAAAPAPVLPDWIAKPTGDDIAWAYPVAAREAKQEGRATIGCHVDGQGRLVGCKLINEAPEGAGFGIAALALAHQFQMKGIDRQGRETAGQDVRIPFRFGLPQPAQ